MKAIKRAISFLLVLVMVFSMFAVAGVSAFADGAPTVVMTANTDRFNESILSISVMSVGAVGLESADMFFEYDSSQIKFRSADKGYDLNAQIALGTEKEPGIAQFSFFTNPLRRDIELCVLTFTVIGSETVTIRFYAENEEGIAPFAESQIEVSLGGSSISGENEHYKYLISGGEITITDSFGFFEENENVEIPAMIEGYPVTCIGERAFTYCDNIKSIVIPDGVKSVDGNAFRSCNGLEKIIIPASVSQIHDVTIGFSVAGNKNEKLIICGEKGSAAEKYAEEFGFKFYDISLGDLGDVMLGDMNGDKIITASDARIALRISARIETATAIQRIIGDVTGDNQITAADARKILRASAHIESL